MILYTEEEYRQVKKLFARSVCRTMSSYVRKVSMEEPVEMIVRNASFDAFIEEIVELRREMGAIRKAGWVTSATEARLVQLYGAIQEKINQIAELCMPR